VVLLDELVGAGDEAHTFQWRLHNAGQWRAVAPDHFTVTEDDVSLDVRFLNDGRMTAELFAAERTAQPGLAVMQAGRRARFLAVLVPRKAGMEGLTAGRLAAEGATAVAVNGDGRRDVVVVADGDRPFTAGPLAGRGAAAILSTGADGPERMMLVRGRELTVDGRTAVSASADVDVARTREGETVVVEVAPPYKTASAGPVVLRVGGWTPGEPCTVAIDDRTPAQAAADADGMLTLELTVDRRRTVRIAPPAGEGG